MVYEMDITRFPLPKKYIVVWLYIALGTYFIVFMWTSNVIFFCLRRNMKWNTVQKNVNYPTEARQRAIFKLLGSVTSFFRPSLHVRMFLFPKRDCERLLSLEESLSCFLQDLLNFGFWPVWLFFLCVIYYIVCT